MFPKNDYAWFGVELWILKIDSILNVLVNGKQKLDARDEHRSTFSRIKNIEKDSIWSKQLQKVGSNNK